MTWSKAARDAAIANRRAKAHGKTQHAANVKAAARQLGVKPIPTTNRQGNRKQARGMPPESAGLKARVDYIQSHRMADEKHEPPWKPPTVSERRAQLKANQARSNKNAARLRAARAKKAGK